MEVDNWLQEALQNFIEDWCKAEVMSSNKDVGFVIADAEGSFHSIKIRWRGYSSREDLGSGKFPIRVGKMSVTPAEALRLFLAGNIGGQDEVGA